MTSNAYSAADPGLPKINRRALLGAVPAVALAPAAALAMSSAETSQTPVERAYWQWREHYSWINGPAFTCFPEDEYRHYEHDNWTLTKEVIGSPSSSARDIVLKMLALTGDGIDFADDEECNGRSLANEALALISGGAPVIPPSARSNEPPPSSARARMIQVIEELEGFSDLEPSSTAAAKCFAAYQMRKALGLDLPDPKMAKLHIHYQKQKFQDYRQSYCYQRDLAAGRIRSIPDCDVDLI